MVMDSPVLFPDTPVFCDAVNEKLEAESLYVTSTVAGELSEDEVAFSIT